jgi:hypothetical protein
MDFRGAITTLQRVLDGNESEEWTIPHELGEEASSTSPTKGRGGKGGLVPDRADADADDRPLEAAVKAKLPTRLRRILEGEAGQGEIERVDKAEILELVRGMNYLERFKAVTSEYATGKPRSVSSVATAEQGLAAAAGDNKKRFDSLNPGSEQIVGQRDDWWKGNTLYEDKDPLSVSDRNHAAFQARRRERNAAGPRNDQLQTYAPADFEPKEATTDPKRLKPKPPAAHPSQKGAVSAHRSNETEPGPNFLVGPKTSSTEK